MQLKSLSIKKFRSINNAYKLNLDSYTVLIGPNNEGKSNIIKSIALGLSILTKSKSAKISSKSSLRFSYGSQENTFYSWNRDFPLNLQEDYPEGKSEITLEFIFNEIEQKEFLSETGINLTTPLKVNLKFAKSEVGVDFLMKGKAKLSMNSKKDAIFSFFNKRLKMQYIPSVRPVELCLDIVDNLIAKELLQLEGNKDYLKAIETVINFQNPILAKISSSVQTTIKEFIPIVNHIEIENQNTIRSAIRHSPKFIIDDGVKTPIEMKGDGIISLAAISLIKYTTNDKDNNVATILAIDEPESHLHSKAIHALKSVLTEIASKQQIIISTHSPLLINRTNIESNIIVENHLAHSAEDISAIRNSLGILLSENLVSADIVLLIEGPEDESLLKPILMASEKIKKAFQKGLLIFDQLGGGSNIAYKCSFWQKNLCNLLVIADYDDAGRNGIEKAIEKGFLLESEYLLTTHRGKDESEMEDYIEIGVYKDKILSEFDVDLSVSSFRGNEKWSKRIEKIFKSSGKLYNTRTISKLKFIVNSSAGEIGESALNQQGKEFLSRLTKAIESKIDKYNKL